MGGDKNVVERVAERLRVVLCLRKVGELRLAAVHDLVCGSARQPVESGNEREKEKEKGIRELVRWRDDAHALRSGAGSAGLNRSHGPGGVGYAALSLAMSPVISKECTASPGFTFQSPASTNGTSGPANDSAFCAASAAWMAMARGSLKAHGWKGKKGKGGGGR